MIPAEAVEAAAKNLYQAGGLTVWEKEDESTRNYYRRNAKSALEAAAPYMLRAAQEVAWAKGATSAGMNLTALQAAGINPNPYRLNNEGEK